MTKEKKRKGVTKRGNLAQYETLRLLQQGHNISEISKYRKIARKNVYKVLSTLVKKGWVTHPTRAIYELTEKGLKGLHSFVGLRYKLRQHNLHFKIEIRKSQRNWNQKRQELRFLPYYNKTLKLKNNEQELFNFGKLQVKTTTKSVIIKVPTIYAREWESAIIQAMQILEDSIPKIEKLFKIRLVSNYKSSIKIISNEYAEIQNTLAKMYRNEGNRMYLTGEDGKIWLITDFSFSTDELEFIHSNKATDDVDAILPFMNDLRKNPTTFSDIRNHVGELQAVVNSDLHNRVKHQSVLDDIKLSQAEILKTFKKINERLDKAGL